MQISLYKTLDERLKELADITITDPLFSYLHNEEETETFFEFSDNNNEFVLNEADSEWSPIEHNLILQQDIVINNPGVLFGEDGVTHTSNKLGIACHVYSKTANFQKTMHIDDIENNSGKITMKYKHEFAENTLGGTLFFDFYIYLKDQKVKEENKINIVGSNVMEESLISYSVLIDGSGSEFPIIEIKDPMQPLWSVETSWTDVYEDLFNESSVRIKLNQDHPIFGQLMNQKNRINQYLMNDIIINAMVMVIQEAILVEKHDFNENMEYQPGTVAQVVWYWISTYEVDTTSLETISNSIRIKTDPFIGGD